jgi:hypothetical protein
MTLIVVYTPLSSLLKHIKGRHLPVTPAGLTAGRGGGITLSAARGHSGSTMICWRAGGPI